MPWEVWLIVLAIFGGLALAYFRIWKHEKANPLPPPPSKSVAEALAFINGKSGPQ